MIEGTGRQATGEGQQDWVESEWQGDSRYSSSKTRLSQRVDRPGRTGTAADEAR